MVAVESAVFAALVWLTVALVVAVFVYVVYALVREEQSKPT